MKNIAKSIILGVTFIGIAAFVFQLHSCKKDRCKEIYSISGRLMNGTTMKPFANEKVSIELSTDYGNKLFKDKYRKLSDVFTNDSGYFKLEYECDGINYTEIAFSNKYIIMWRDMNIKFEEHLNHTFYYATEGSCKIILREEVPLNNDTLFVGIQKVDYIKYKKYWYSLDSFTTRQNRVWKLYLGQTGGQGVVIASRGRNLLNKLSIDPGPGNKYNGKNYWDLSIEGDPFVDSIVVKY